MGTLHPVRCSTDARRRRPRAGCRCGGEIQPAVRVRRQLRRPYPVGHAGTEPSSTARLGPEPLARLPDLAAERPGHSDDLRFRGRRRKGFGCWPPAGHPTRVAPAPAGRRIPAVEPDIRSARSGDDQHRRQRRDRFRWRRRYRCQRSRLRSVHRKPRGRRDTKAQGCRRADLRDRGLQRHVGAANSASHQQPRRCQRVRRGLFRGPAEGAAADGPGGHPLLPARSASPGPAGRGEPRCLRIDRSKVPWRRHRLRRVDQQPRSDQLLPRARWPAPHQPRVRARRDLHGQHRDGPRHHCRAARHREGDGERLHRLAPRPPRRHPAADLRRRHHRLG